MFKSLLSSCDILLYSLCERFFKHSKRFAGSVGFAALACTHTSVRDSPALIGGKMCELVCFSYYMGRVSASKEKEKF